MPYVRLPHIIKRPRSVTIPRRIMVFDTESYQERCNGDERYIGHHLRLGSGMVGWLSGGSVSNATPFSFTTGEGFLHHLERTISPRETTWVFTHSTAFDLSLVDFWRAVTRGFGEITSYCVQDPPTIIHWKRGRCRVCFVDTLNYWRMPLSAIGESIGEPKWDMPDMARTDGEWLEYCRQDVRILFLAVSRLINFIASNGLGSFGATAASQAWNAYRHRFMHTGIQAHANADATKLERSSYFGGRCDAFYTGRVEGLVHVYDANSLYPWTMHEFPCPRRLDRVVFSMHPAELLDATTDRSCIASVKVSCSTSQYPIRSRAETLYCAGLFDTVLCGNELRSALDRGDVRAVGQVNLYHQDYLFSDFVEWFYAEKIRCKQEGDFAGAFVAKSILNSLSGKFGQRSNQWVQSPGDLADRQFGTWKRTFANRGDSYICRAVCGSVQRLVDRGEARDSFPAISATITANGRDYLERIRENLGNNEVYYQDTDSLHLAGRAIATLRNMGKAHDTALGKFRQEKCLYQPIYRGYKNYSDSEQRTVAGVKARATEIADGVYLQDKGEGLKTILQTEPSGIVRFREHRLDRSSERHRRIVGPDGWTQPIVLRDYPRDMNRLIEIGTAYIDGTAPRVHPGTVQHSLPGFAEAQS